MPKLHQNTTSLLRRLMGDEGGNVFMIFGLGALVIIAAVGAAIDLGTQQLVRAKLQQATDAAAIAAANAPNATTADQTAIATRYYNANFPNSYLGITRPAPLITTGNSTITVSTGDYSMNTRFIRLLGIDQLTTTVSSTVNYSSTVQAYDLVLVIDNSASMAFNDVTGTSLQGNTAVDPAEVQACDNLYYGYYYPTYTLANIDSGVCNLSVATNDAIPTSNQTQQSYGLLGVDRLNAVRYAANTIATNLLAAPNTAGNRIAIVTWSDATQGILPFTSDYTAVSNELTSMYALGATNSTSALTAVQNNYVGNFDPTHVHAVVLLTDGHNSTVGNLKYNPKTKALVDSAGCLGTDESPPCAQTNADSQKICDIFYASQTYVYTIAFGQLVTDPSNPYSRTAWDFLQACAHPDPAGGSNLGEYFFIAPDADELNSAFRTIYNNLKKVRISQ